MVEEVKATLRGGRKQENTAKKVVEYIEATVKEQEPISKKG